MSFVWTEDISPGAAAMAAGMNEVQDNLDTIYTALGITRGGCGAGAGWTEFPIAAGLVIGKLSAQPQQLRAAADYAYDNKCPAYNGTYQAGVDTTEETGYQNAAKPGYDSSNKPGYVSNEHGTYCGTDESGYDSTYNPGFDSFHDTSGE